MVSIINIAIVDDNIFYINEIEKLLRIYISDTAYTVYTYTDSDSFLDSLDDIDFDIVFLDIILDKRDGIETGMCLNEKCPDVNVIFVSSNADYFRDVYKVTHSYFLTKDFEEERFADAISKVMKLLKRNVFSFHVKNHCYTIKLSDVLFFEGYMRHTAIYLTDGCKNEYNINIRDIEAILPKSDFVRTHQSYIVNMRYIAKYSRQSVTMINGRTVPVSRSYTDTAREKITLFLGGVI